MKGELDDNCASMFTLLLHVYRVDIEIHDFYVTQYQVENVIIFKFNFPVIHIWVSLCCFVNDYYVWNGNYNTA